MMWRIKHIFDGDYGCEELAPGEKPKVTVTLVNEEEEEKMVFAEDDWLTEHDLDIGSQWPETMFRPLRRASRAISEEAARLLLKKENL